MPNANWLQIFDAKTVSEVVMVMITSNAPKFHLHFEQKNPKWFCKEYQRANLDRRGRNIKMTEHTRKILFPRLFASNETKVGNAASGCCVSKYDLGCLSVWFPFIASLWHLSLSLFSFLSAFFFGPLFLSLWRADGRQLGCDPITDWLQQSPSADWFYNPHSRSQMGENQLVKKRCAAIKLHAGTLTHAQTHGNTHTPMDAHPLSWYRYCLRVAG